MTEQNQTPTDTDDTEGHVHLRPAEDTGGYHGTEDDTHGHHYMRNDTSDDTSGHMRARDDDEDDTEGHRIF